MLNCQLLFCFYIAILKVQYGSNILKFAVYEIDFSKQLLFMLQILLLVMANLNVGNFIKAYETSSLFKIFLYWEWVIRLIICILAEHFANSWNRPP